MSNKLRVAAVDTCREAVAENPDRWDLYQRFVQQLLARGRADEVVKRSRAIVTRDPSRTDASYYLAVGLRKMGRCVEAIEQYVAYARLNPDDPDPYFGIALCQEALEDHAASIAAYQTYLARAPKGSLRRWRAKALQRIAALQRGQAVGAQTIAAAARGASEPTGPLRQGKRSPPATILSGTTASSKPRQPADCSAEEKAIAANPFSTDAYDRFVSCAARLHRYQAIIRYMRMALRDNPGYSRAWLHLGQAERATGRPARAKRSLARACAAGVTEACAD